MGVNEFYALKTEVYWGNTLSLCVLPVKPLKEISPVFFLSVLAAGKKKENHKCGWWHRIPRLKNMMHLLKHTINLTLTISMQQVGILVAK